MKTYPVQNLEVVEVRAEENLLLIKGSVPGAQRGVVIIRRAREGAQEDSGASQRKGKSKISHG
jgi:large subunit ribosomal protein L3